MPRIVLASTSPRRHELMSRLGVEFEICAPDFEEVMNDRIDAGVLASALALGKARSLRNQRPDDVIVAADTFITTEHGYLGKPVDDDAARRTLRALSGKRCTIATGYAVVQGSRETSDTVFTHADIVQFTDETLDDYIASGLHVGKAGGVSIEAVTLLDGDTSAALGLPLQQVGAALADLGFPVVMPD